MDRQKTLRTHKRHSKKQSHPDISQICARSLSLSSRQHLHAAVQHTDSSCTLMPFSRAAGRSHRPPTRQPFLVNAPILSYNSLMWNTMFPDIKKKKNKNHPLNFFLAIVLLLMKKRQTSDHFHFILSLLFPLYFYLTTLFQDQKSLEVQSRYPQNPISTLSRFFFAWRNIFKSNSWIQKAVDCLKPNLATTPPSIICTNIFPLT